MCPFLGNTSSHTDRAEGTTGETLADIERPETREAEEQEYELASQSTSASISTNVDEGNLIKSESADVPMETESSQNDAQAVASLEDSTSSHDRTDKRDDVWDESRSADEASCANMDSKQENMMENLQDRLTTMRDGFLER